MKSETQAERSAATRAALAQAGLELLVERGWPSVTSVAVVERAGLTRGALMHHYDGLSDLLTDAIRQLHDQYAAATVSPTSLVETIDSMWSVVGDRNFRAAIEAWVAVGHDAELATTLTPVVSAFARLVHPDQDAILPASATAADRGLAYEFLLSTRSTMVGLALGRTFGEGWPATNEAIVLKHLRREAARLDSVMAARSAEG